MVCGACSICRRSGWPPAQIKRIAEAFCEMFAAWADGRGIPATPSDQQCPPAHAPAAPRKAAPPCRHMSSPPVRGPRARETRERGCRCMRQLNRARTIVPQALRAACRHPRYRPKCLAQLPCTRVADACPHFRYDIETIVPPGRSSPPPPAPDAIVVVISEFGQTFREYADGRWGSRAWQRLSDARSAASRWVRRAFLLACLLLAPLAPGASRGSGGRRQPGECPVQPDGRRTGEYILNRDARRRRITRHPRRDPGRRQGRKLGRAGLRASHQDRMAGRWRLCARNPVAACPERLPGDVGGAAAV